MSPRKKPNMCPSCGSVWEPFCPCGTEGVQKTMDFSDMVSDLDLQSLSGPSLLGGPATFSNASVTEAPALSLADIRAAVKSLQSIS